MFRAKLEVDTYDDDFCFTFDGKRVDEGTSVTGDKERKKSSALLNLLNRLSIDDYNQLGLNTSHVSYVKSEIRDMISLCRNNKMPCKLSWSGNWELEFSVEKVCKKDTEACENDADIMIRSLRGMLESYKILINESPLSENKLAIDVIKGAFIGEIPRVERILNETNHS